MSAYKKPRYDPQKLDMLVELRKKAKVSQGQAASFFEMKDYGSIANWETGKSKPRVSRRPDFIIYLIDKLGLRHDYEQFLKIWHEVMVGEWMWAPLTEPELQHAFPGHNRTVHSIATEEWGQVEPMLSQGGELAELAKLVLGQRGGSSEVMWALAPGDGPPKRLANGITCHSLYLIVIPQECRSNSLKYREKQLEIPSFLIENPALAMPQ